MRSSSARLVLFSPATSPCAILPSAARGMAAGIVMVDVMVLTGRLSSRLSKLCQPRSRLGGGLGTWIACNYILQRIARRAVVAHFAVHAGNCQQGIRHLGRIRKRLQQGFLRGPRIGEVLEIEVADADPVLRIRAQGARRKIHLERFKGANRRQKIAAAE